MPLLDTGLKSLFCAAFGPLYRDGVLTKHAVGDHPVKVMVEAQSVKARAESGLPLSAVTLSLLASSLPVAPDLDDVVTVGGQGYRILRIEIDPAGAAFSLDAVPA